MAGDYVTWLNGWAYYQRRVPKAVRAYDDWPKIRVALDTRDADEAHKRARQYNEHMEEFWRTLVRSGGTANRENEYKRAVALARAQGFAYRSSAEIAKSAISDIVTRIESADQYADNREEIAHAVLGGVDKPTLPLSDALETYWPLVRDQIAHKTEHAARKWKNPRAMAFNNFIGVVGDKDIAAVSRSDILKFREHLMNRIEHGLHGNSANRQMQNVKNVLRVVGNAMEVETDFDELFRKTRFKDKKNQRQAFTADYIQNTLLSPDNLDGLNDQCRLLVMAMADTGARESELIGLESDDIVLETEVPYIWIRENAKSGLKVEHAERCIPLVGAALTAFREMPEGFAYKTADSASNIINNYWRDRGLRPSQAYSLYSLRHAFKDRLRDAGAPEEMIDELMGHKKAGPLYGRGHTLAKKRDWLAQISFHLKPRD